MNESLKLSVYFGERDRAGSALLADALLDLYERQQVAAAILLRGTEGFGLEHHLHTERFLTLSEDLPAVAIAIDSRERIEALLREVRALARHGLITLERARMSAGPVGELAFPVDLHEAARLTLYLGRKERVGGRPAYQTIVEYLWQQGVAGATVLLGVDGTVRGRRERARFFGRNADVPLMILSVGDGPTMARVLPYVTGMLREPLLTLERIRVCKRDGRLLTEPGYLPQTDASGLPLWQKLMVYAGEQARHGSHPLSIELVHQLRRAGAAGATAVRGIWGYHGDHAPHGDTVFALRRRVPIVTVIVDAPDRIRQWFEIVDEVTDQTGLVTSEIVPALRAAGPGIERGSTRLARYWR